jgi:hypothetical protein
MDEHNTFAIIKQTEVPETPIVEQTVLDTPVVEQIEKINVEDLYFDHFEYLSDMSKNRNFRFLSLPHRCGGFSECRGT